MNNYEIITPEMAQALLANNAGNRKLNKQNIARWANAMRNGRWMRTGEAIKIADTGRLLDGQNRLTAVVESNTPTEFLVVRGLDEDVFAVLDSGTTRSIGQALGFNVQDAMNKAAATRLLFIHEIGLDPRMKSATKMVDRFDIKSHFDLNAADLDTFDRPAWHMYHGVGGNLSSWLAFMVLANRANPKMAEEFFSTVLTGANLSAGDPRLALRNYLANPKRRRTSNAEMLGLVIKAWNQWLSGEQRSLASFKDSEEWPDLRSKRSVQSRTLFSVSQAA